MIETVSPNKKNDMWLLRRALELKLKKESYGTAQNKMV
jgi:hypothetical protein